MAKVIVEIIGKDSVSGAFSSATSGLQKLGGLATGVVGAGLGIVAAGFGFAAKSAIEMNSTLETSTLQFETLMGDADRAEQHVASLFEFAKKTPFETGPIIEASKLMQTFGGDVLNTTGNLTLVGDAAAATNAPINELGFWVGRLFSNLQAGQPFGEAAMRLQELAVMSPQARQEMERLQEAGASADEIFAVFQEDLGKFSGSMERQAGTWQGLTSTISDALNITIATALRPFFDLAKEGLGSLANLLSSPAITEGAQRIAEALALLFGQLLAGNVNLAQLLELFGMGAVQAQTLAASILNLTNQVIAFVQPIIDNIAEFVSWKDILIALGVAVASFLIPIIATFIASILSVMAPIVAVIAIVALLRNAWENDWGGIQEKTQAVVLFIQNVITTVFSAIQAFWQAHGDTIMAAAENTWNFIKGTIENITQFITGLLNAFRAAREGDWRAFGEALRQMWDAAWAQIINIVSTAWENIKLGIATITNGIISWFQNINWGQVGSGIVSGIAGGITGGIPAIVSAARNAAQAALDAAKGFLGIQSPSILFYEVGQNIVAGLVNALNDGTEEVEDAVGELLSFGSVFASLGNAAAQRLKDQVLDPLADEMAKHEDTFARMQQGLADHFGVSVDELMANFSRFNLQAITSGDTRALALINGMAQAQSDLNASTAEYEEQQQRLLALQQAQQDLAFLEQQTKLLDLISEHGLDAEQILGGMELGVNASLEGVISAMTAAMNAIIQQTEDELGIHSPSKVFERIGGFITEGLTKGINTGKSLMSNAVQTLTSPPPVGGVRVAGGGGTVLNFNIDARGAEPGVEKSIEKAVDRALRKAGIKADARIRTR